MRRSTLLRNALSAIPCICAVGLTANAELPDPFTRYGPYELPIEEVAAVDLVFETDLEIVVPTFQSLSRTDPELLGFIASGSLPVAERFADVLSETGWGHLVPYVYAASYNFLGRIYYGISSEPALADGSDLLPKQPLSAGRITLRLISNLGTWERYSERVGHYSVRAYWDPLRSEVGIYIDRAMFDAAAAQAQWSGRDPVEHIARLESYVTRLFVRELGHELFHAIQRYTPSPAYDLPLLSESAALFAQHNGLMREELTTLSRAQAGAVADPGAAIDQCLGSTFEDNWRGDYYAIEPMYRAHRYVGDWPTFSLTRLLAMGSEEFYGVSGAELSSRYAIAASLFWFLRDMNEEMLAIWHQVLAEASVAASERDDQAALQIDSRYRAWLDARADEWWDHPEARERYVLARSSHSQCLNARVFAPAWAHAIAAGAYWPGSPTPPLYLGDLFWRIGEYYTAFEYYTLASEVDEPMRYGEAPSRISERLGNAAEQLGRMEVAIEMFRQVKEMPIEGPAFVLVFARSALKTEYYELTEPDTWRTEASRERLRGYLEALQSPENAAAANRLFAREDWEAYMLLVVEHYEAVRERMLEQLAD